MAMNWWKEVSFYLGKRLQIDDDTEIERLLLELGIPQTQLWHDAGVVKILDQNEAHKRIREALKFRWGNRGPFIAAGVSIAGAIVAWLAV